MLLNTSLDPEGGIHVAHRGLLNGPDRVADHPKGEVGEACCRQRIGHLKVRIGITNRPHKNRRTIVAIKPFWRVRDGQQGSGTVKIAKDMFALLVYVITGQRMRSVVAKTDNEPDSRDEKNHRGDFGPEDSGLAKHFGGWCHRASFLNV